MDQMKDFALVLETTQTPSELAAVFNDNAITYQASSRNTFDGAVGSLLVLATVTVRTLPDILEALSDVIKSRRLQRLKFGELELEYPTNADVRAMLSALEHKSTND
jgi:predicted Zn-dependent peptidase